MKKEEKDINTVSMEVILNASNGDKYVDKALNEISKFNFDNADTLLVMAKKSIIKAHNAQTAIIQCQASGQDVEYSLLFIHAQDTLMTTKSKLNIVEGLEPILRILWERGKRNHD